MRPTCCRRARRTRSSTMPTPAAASTCASRCRATWRAAYRLGGSASAATTWRSTTPTCWSPTAYIGELLDRARRLGLLDDALVIFTADHGESLGEHGSWFEHGPLPYNTTARVPLLLRQGRGLGGRRVERPVELVDLYPTLRELVVPRREVRGLEGKSLAPWLSRAGRARPWRALPLRLLGGGRAAALLPQRPGRRLEAGAGLRPPRQARRRCPAAGSSTTSPPIPAETGNLAESRQPEELRRLRGELLRWVATGAERGPARESGADEDARRRCRRWVTRTSALSAPATQTDARSAES